MTVLVTAASKHGATREIAEEITRVLDEHGVPAELLDIDDVTDLSGYEAHVVGSGIYLESCRARCARARGRPSRLGRDRSLGRGDRGTAKALACDESQVKGG